MGVVGPTAVLDYLGTAEGPHRIGRGLVRQGLIKSLSVWVVGDAQDGECSFGFVADGAGGLGDVVGSEDLQGADGEVGGAGLVGGEADDRVDVLAGFGPAGGFAAAVDPEGEVGVGERDAAEVVGDGAGLDRAGLASKDDELLDELLSQPIETPPGGYVLRDTRDVEATPGEPAVEES